MSRRLLALLGSLVVAGGVGLAEAPAASAEPRPGQPRIGYGCYLNPPYLVDLGFPLVVCKPFLKG